MIEEIIKMNCIEAKVKNFSLSTIADGFAMLQKDFFIVDYVICQLNIFNNISINFKESPFAKINDLKLIEQGIIAQFWGAYVSVNNIGDNVILISGKSCDSNERRTVKLLLS